VTVNCTGLLGLFVSYAISLSPGNSGNQLNRSMSSGGGQLGYNIYTDLTHTMIWGDGTGGTSTVSGSFVLVLLGNTATYTAYGHMPAQQIVPAGSYSDAPTLTVTY
jgi:spore coat protein U-like protein